MSKSYTYEKTDASILVIESKDAHNKGGFKMTFTGEEGKPAQFVLTEEIAKTHNTTVEALNKKIEAHPSFGRAFWSV